MTEVSSVSPVTPISTAGDNPPPSAVLISAAEPTTTTPPITIASIVSNQTQKPSNIPPIRPGAQFSFSLETPSLSSGTLDKYLKSIMFGNDSSHALPDMLKPAVTMENPTINPQQAFSSASSDKLPTMLQDSIPICKTDSDNTVIKKKEDEEDEDEDEDEPDSMMETSTSTQITTTNADRGEVIPIPRGQQYVDITEYLNMPQSDAAKKLGIPPSTLSKRWKEAVRKRKWPYRMICKIDKEIMTLLHNVPQGPNAPPLPEEIETALGQLLRRRQEELKPVVIRI